MLNFSLFAFNVQSLIICTYIHTYTYICFTIPITVIKWLNMKQVNIIMKEHIHMEKGLSTIYTIQDKQYKRNDMIQ